MYWRTNYFFKLLANKSIIKIRMKTESKEVNLMINAHTKVVNVIDDPLFKGYGRLIFPTAFGRPSSSMTLSQVGQLLIYHNYVNTDVTVDVIRELEKQRMQDTKIFYDIYTEDEKRQDPEKRDTGLFFFKGSKNAPFAVICAGGGFYYVGSIHESMPHALWLARHGYNAFALVYRTRTADAACQDLSRAISFIFAHKDELGVDTKGYSLWGGSAGARMAAYTGSFGPVPRAAAVIMQYTGYSLYTQQDPPTYACVGGRDYIADWRIMKRRLDCLEKCGIPTEFHMYPNLKHGFGLGIETQAQGWIDDALRFWERNRKA